MGLGLGCVHRKHLKTHNIAHLMDTTLREVRRVSERGKERDDLPQVVKYKEQEGRSSLQLF